MLSEALCIFAAMGALPDHSCTPGDVYPQVTPSNVHHTICVPGWAKRHRHVTYKQRRLVWAKYGLAPQKGWEFDHLVPLELGGTNRMINLFPQAPPYWRQKDRQENALHKLVCQGEVPLRDAQRIMAIDWR